MAEVLNASLFTELRLLPLIGTHGSYSLLRRLVVHDCDCEKDAIAVACENREGIPTALRKATFKGIKISTYFAGDLRDARNFFVNQATIDGIGNALMDNAARLLGWRRRICQHHCQPCGGKHDRVAATHRSAARGESSCRENGALRPCDDLKDKAQSQATALLSVHPTLKLIMASCSLSGPGAAEAVKPAGKVRRVKVIGLGLPNENRGHMNECVTDTVILGMAEDLGNLTVYAARSLATGSWKPGDQTCQAGKLGEFAIQGDNILLGSPCFSTKANIDQFDF